MSVIIKDMDVQSLCSVCPLGDGFNSDFHPYCRYTYKDVPFDGKPDDCPLSEYPEDDEE